MKYLSTKELVEYLEDYAESKSYPHAIMLNGPWGSGKTHFITHLTNNESNGDYLGKTNKTWIYLSLYGINSVGQFWDAIHAKMIDYKTNGFSESKIAALARIGISSYLRVHGVTKEAVSEASSALGIVGELLFNPNECVFVLDDFERCGIPMEERLGVISVLLEEMDAKVIVVANECYIIDKEDKYKTSKEKVIGNTIEYHTSMREKIVDILSIERYKELGSFENILVNYIEINGINNLRHIEYGLEIFKKIKSKIDPQKPSIENYEAKIETVLFENVMTVCIWHRNRGERMNWNNERLFVYTNHYNKNEDAQDNENWMVAFHFIETYIYDSYFDLTEAMKAIIEYDDYLSKKELINDPINRLNFCLEMNDDEVLDKINQMKDNLSKGLYSLNDYRNIMFIIEYLFEIGFKDIKIDWFIETITNNLEKDKYLDFDVCKRRDTSEILVLKHEKIIKEIQKIEKLKEFENSAMKKLDDSLDADDSVENVFSYLREIKDSSKDGLFEIVNVEKMGDYIYRSSEEKLLKFHTELLKMFRPMMGNQLTDNEKNKIFMLIDILKNKEINGIVKKYNTNRIIKSLEKIPIPSKFMDELNK